MSQGVHVVSGHSLTSRVPLSIPGIATEVANVTFIVLPCRSNHVTVALRALENAALLVLGPYTFVADSKSFLKNYTFS